MSSWQSSEPFTRFGAELSKGVFAKITEDYILGELKDRWSGEEIRLSASNQKFDKRKATKLSNKNAPAPLLTITTQRLYTPTTYLNASAHSELVMSETSSLLLLMPRLSC
jgi:hypothetical protein